MLLGGAVQGFGSKMVMDPGSRVAGDYRDSTQSPGLSQQSCRSIFGKHGFCLVASAWQEVSSLFQVKKGCLLD